MNQTETLIASAMAAPASRKLTLDHQELLDAVSTAGDYRIDLGTMNEALAFRLTGTLRQLAQQAGMRLAFSSAAQFLFMTVTRGDQT